MTEHTNPLHPGHIPALHAEPMGPHSRREQDLQDRIATACRTASACAFELGRLWKTQALLTEAAQACGYVPNTDGTVSISPTMACSQAERDEMAWQRASYEQQIALLAARRESVEAECIAMIRDVLGVSPDGRGIPWTIMECVRLGIDPSAVWAHGATGPESDLRDLLVHLCADVKLAKILVAREGL